MINLRIRNQHIILVTIHLRLMRVNLPNYSKKRQKKLLKKLRAVNNLKRINKLSWGETSQNILKVYEKILN